MRVTVIGAAGHIGTYLVPRLVEAGHEVTAVTRGRSSPYRPDGAWSRVRMVAADRVAEDRAQTFAARIRGLDSDAVIDLICFEPSSAAQLVDALHGRVRHFLHCGTIWTHGAAAETPQREEAPKRPFGAYGIKKLEIENLLLDAARHRGFPATILHPGHIVGEGWAPVNPQGHVSPWVFSDLACGRALLLPNFGMETVHHVHADDVAQAFERALARRAAALGESFHVLSPAALTLRGYAAAIAAWFGQEARFSFLPFAEWRGHVAPEEASITWDHIAHSPNGSVAKARQLLDYQPRYTSLEAVKESVRRLIAEGKVDAPPAWS